MRVINSVLVLIMTVFILASCGENVENAKIDYGKSEIYSQQDMEEAVGKVLEKFETWNGFTLYTISYMGDEHSQEKIDYCNKIKKSSDFEECIVFSSEFRTGKTDWSGFSANMDINNWTWTLAREKGGEWNLVMWGIE